MTLEERLLELKKTYNVLSVVDLTPCLDKPLSWAKDYLLTTCQDLHCENYKDNERLVFVLPGDIYCDAIDHGVMLHILQTTLNKIDISNFFAIVLTPNPDVQQELESLSRASTDPVRISAQTYHAEFAKNTANIQYADISEYAYGSPNPLKISLSQLEDRERYLLVKSKTFCMVPWMHLHVWPTGEAFPCCHADGTENNSLGSCKTQTLKEIWNSDEYKQLRLNMLNDQTSSACRRCYEQDESGFFSGRRSANKHYGHHIGKIFETQPDGTLENFEMLYWDIRFSNLCNLSCRSCGHIFSSSWYADQIKLAGDDYKTKHKALNVAGRSDTDLLDQLLEHIDCVEQIYFAGGEPLLMIEHYKILEELERRKKFHVRLIYNTNFTEVKLKDRLVFDYWKKFDSVAVGASLDAQGTRAEYIRKGTNWDRVEHNRRQMLEICPNVDFYVSSTLSIMNAWHMPDFHRDWVERGFIKPGDFNVNILQHPRHYRIDIAPTHVKEQLTSLYNNHIAWLEQHDVLRRASVGFASAINFMNAQDNSQLLGEFWRRTNQLDTIRKENIIDVLPELRALTI